MGHVIYIKLHYTILGRFSSDTTNVFYFENIIKDKNPVKIELLSKENAITATQEVSISENLFEFLQTKEKNVPDQLKDELSEIKSDGSLTIKRVISFIKYSLAHFDLDERLVSSRKAEWSTNNTDWQALPNIFIVVVDGYSSYPLNAKNAELIQRYINTDFEPFLALKYIHKAKNDILPRDKWIDATIAAELAIKEFLIRLKPEIETLLLNMPSPPLDKLYGVILESFGFNKSPKVKEIQKGVQTRNELIHRPKEKFINMDHASEYVRDINIAIHHLMTLLYPNDSFIKSYYENIER